MKKKVQKPEVKPESKSILEEAQGIVEGSRKQDYGKANESFARIATLTQTLCTCQEKLALRNGEFPDTVVVKVLMSVKLVRETNATKRDNLVALCGYAELLSQLQEGR